MCPPLFTTYFANKNERLSGVKMKKFVLLLLVFSLILCLPGCKLFNKKTEEAPASAGICEIANRSKPTKTITTVSYATNSGDTLSGYYKTTTDGSNVIFEYYYEKLATPEESLASGDYRRVVPYEGVINYKDGVYTSGDNESWRPGTGTAYDLKLNFDVELFKNATVSEDGKSLEATFSASELKAFIGTDLNAVGNATVTIEHNGTNLTSITVSCSTANGKLTIRNSYTYNKQDLTTEA